MGHDRLQSPESAPHSRQPAEKRAASRCLGRTKGGLNSKLHAVCDGQGKPVVLLLIEGQTSDHKGARLLFDKLPSAQALIGNRGYDSNGLRDALSERGIKPCIPPTKNRKEAIDYDKALYKQRHKIENMFAKLKDGRHRHAL